MTATAAPEGPSGEPSSGTRTASLASAMSPRELRIVLVAVMTGMFLGAIDGTIVATALPTIVGDLGGQSQAPWIGTGFLLAQTIGTPIIGKLSDIYGRKVTFQATIVAFLVTSLLCGIAQTMFQLVAFRFLQGVAAAGLLALPFAIMGDLMSPTERARHQGYASGAYLVAALVGPLLGGLIVDASSWRWIFLINIPVGAVALVAIQRHLMIPRKPTRAAIDIPGAVTLSLASGPLVVGLLWSGQQRGWTSATTLGLFAIAAAGTVAFIVVESRANEPILPLSLFANRIVRTTLIGGFVSGVAIYALSSYSPVFMQIVHGTSATASGLWSIPNMVMVTFASITSGRLIARYGSYRPYPILGCLCMGIGAVLLATMDLHTSTPSVALRASVIGLGMGQLGPSMNLIVQNAVRYQDLGVATAGLTFIRSLGGVLGSAVLGAVYRNRLDVLIPRFVGEDTVRVIGPERLQGRPSVIQALPEPVRSATVRAYSDSITTTCAWAIPAVVVALVIFITVPVIPLRDNQ